MNPIPEKIRMGFFERSGAIRISPQHFAYFALHYILNTLHVTKGRRGKYWHLVFFSSLINSHGITQRSRNRLINEQWFACTNYLHSLLEVKPPIVCFEKNIICLS